MSNSSLATKQILSPNYNDRTQKICKITPHHAAGKLKAESLARCFSTKDRGASCNYAIGYDGEIILVVPEDKRAWTSSSSWNDQRAITVEISNDGGADTNWHISDESIEAFINLAVDICKRNGMSKVEFTGDKDGSITFHKMFKATTCPGPYLESRINDIVTEINNRLNPPKQEETVTKPVTNSSTLTAGAKLNLKDVPLYSSAAATRRAATKTGTFFLWNNEVVNGKIRITNSTSNVGVSGKVTGFITEADAKASLVNNTPTQPAVSTKLNAQQLAEAIKAGKYGNGDARIKNLKAEGYTDAEISAAQAIVNASMKVPNTATKPLAKGDLVRMNSTATKWATGAPIPNWVKEKALYVRSTPIDGKCQVSTVRVGAITGIAFVRDLRKV